MTPDLILLIAAFICFVLAALQSRINIGGDLNLVALGLAFWVLTLMVG